MEYPNVRRAQRTDQETVGELWMQLLDEQAALDDRFGVADDALERWKNDFPMWLDEETSRLYVAEDAGEVLGFVTARRWGPPPIYADSSEVYLEELFVHPEARRQGFGTQLVHAVVDWTDRLGAERVRLNVLTANNAARAFWAAQEAIPMTMTFTIERSPEGDRQADEGSKKIGF